MAVPTIRRPTRPAIGVDTETRSMPAEGRDILISDRLVVGLPEADVDLLIDRLLESAPGAPSPLDLIRFAGGAVANVRGMRHFLAEAEGQGYWDFLKSADYLVVGITDAIYRKRTWIHGYGGTHFKLRLLLSGELLNEAGKVIASGPQALITVCSTPGPQGLYVAPKVPIQMVVLYCRPEVLTKTLGVMVNNIPVPLDLLFQASQQNVTQRLGAGRDLYEAARRIINSRHDLPAALRVSYVESMGMQILCRSIGDLSNAAGVRQVTRRVSAREINRILEARDYLAQHFARPPLIAQLARMVGMNQTKLKFGFRNVLNTTIYDFVLKCRMERASQLLLSDGHSISQVAFAVGYEHPASFTAAFKRHVGVLPSAWRRGRQRQ